MPETTLTAPLGSLTRLGDSPEFAAAACELLGAMCARSTDNAALAHVLQDNGWTGTRLLDLLQLAGWEVAVAKPFAGEQLPIPLGGQLAEASTVGRGLARAKPDLVIVNKGGYSFQAVGPVDEVGVGLFIDAVRTQGIRLMAA